MTDGNLERVEVSAEADVTNRRADNEEVNRFRGQQMTLYFDATGLRRALVKGEAELVSRLQEDEEIAVQRGQRRRVGYPLCRRVTGRGARLAREIEGRYYPPAEEP